MQSNWPIKKLGEVAECQDGDWILSKDLATGNDVRLIQLGDIGEGKFLDKTSKYISKGRCEQLKCTLLNSGDILLARLGEPLGKACIFPGFPYPCITAVDVTIIRQKELIDRNFLHNYLNSKTFKDQVNSVSSGATRKRISRKNLENLEIPVPGIEEQRRIVKKLEKILAKIEEARILRQESIEKSQTVIRSVLRKTFDDLSRKYAKKEIKDFGEVKGGKRLPAGHTFASLPTEYPYLRVVDFKDYSIDTSNMKYLGAATQQEISHYTISDQDAYISIAGTIGTVGTIPPQLSGANLTENAAKIVFSEEVNNRFVIYFLDSPQGKEEIKKRTNQVGQPKLALMRIETIEMPLPDLKEQGKIVAYLDGLSEKVHALQQLQQDQLQDLESLQQSVLHQAFQGEL